MYSEDDFIQLSALQHYLFCERQCYLIHREMIWQDNLFTAEGNVMHERADEQKLSRSGPDIKTETALYICSRTLGLAGKADVVEFHKEGNSWIPFPVEYKRGKPKENRCDEVQLCAQALCLEEMLSVSVKQGAFFYGKTRRRVYVDFDDILRDLTKDICEKVHLLLKQEKASAPIYSKEKCDACSLKACCIPQICGKSAIKYIDEIMGEK